MITFKELHKKTLPEHKKQYVKLDVVSYYLWRPICDFITILLLKTSISATSVTILSFYAGILGLLSFIFIPNFTGALLGYFFIWVWNIADGVDGNIARYTDTCSKAGDLWDAVGGYMAMVAFYLGAGIIASSENSFLYLEGLDSSAYILMGAVAAISNLFPRLATQKKQVVYGKKNTAELKDRTQFGIVKILALNITSINGLAGLLLLIAILAHMVNIFVIIYFVIMLLFGGASTYIVLRKAEK